MDELVKQVSDLCRTAKDQDWQIKMLKQTISGLNLRLVDYRFEYEHLKKSAKDEIKILKSNNDRRKKDIEKWLKGCSVTNNQFAKANDKLDEIGELPKGDDCETCPKCGAKTTGHLKFKCGTYYVAYDGVLMVSNECLRNQLATITKERDASDALLDKLVQIMSMRDNMAIGATDQGIKLTQI